MNIEKLLGKKVEDEFLAEHKITGIINKGGQGVVCKTENESIVLKFCFGENENLICKSENPDLYNSKSNEIKAVYLNPFPENLHLAYPIAILRDYVGYVMRLMDGMENCSKLSEINTYPQTGSYRRRFELLSRAACVLSQIHANGMVYCDISPNNMFVTENVKSKNQNMWFIDSDNIHIQSEKNGRLVYTPRYAAPEIIKQQSRCTQASDVYSFAIVAFEALACNHPFEGDMISGGWEKESCAWDETTTKGVPQAGADIGDLYSGDLPWIEDPEDTRNHTTNGLPRQAFLNEELFNLFNKTFNKTGRENPQERPTVYFWAKAFAKAADTTVCCSDPECNMSHVFDEETDLVKNQCPYCDAKLGKILIVKSEDKLVFTREIEKGKTIEIPERVFLPFDMIKNSLPLIEVELEDGRLLVRKTESSTAEKTDILCDGEKVYNKIFDAAKHVAFMVEGKTFTLTIEGGK